MNSKYSTTNLLFFTLERCDNYNSDDLRPSPAWRVRSHPLFGWYPIWGPFQFTRLSAILVWLGGVWEEVTYARRHKNPKSAS